ncbi:MAG: hypothetical protein Q9169_006809 [Polycauliona sp. 2 TL-2023]
MADQSKPSFSFGKPASGNSSGGLFGQQDTASSQPQSSLFGSSNKPTSSSTTLFGAATTAGNGPSIFAGGVSAPAQSPGVFGGSGAGGSSGGAGLFGGGSNKPTTGFSFGGQSSAAQPSGEKPSPFGQAQSSGNQQPGTSAPFSGFATPSKPADPANAGPGQPPSLFGGGSSTLFQKPTPSAPESAATPTSKPAWSFGALGSTTPAGPPPSSQASASSLFGQNANNQQQEKKSVFPSLGGASSTSQSGASTGAAPKSQNAPAPGTGFLGNLGKPQASSSTQPFTPAGGSSDMFANLGGQSSAGSSTAQPAPSLFGKPAQPSTTEAQNPTFTLNNASSSQPSALNSQKPQEAAPSPFSLGGQSKLPGSSGSTSSAPTTSMFANIGKQGDTSASAAPSTNPFSNLGSQNTTTSTAPSSGATAPSFFSSLGRAQDTPSTTAGAATTSNQTQAQIPSLTSNIFQSGQPSTSAAPSQPTQATNASTSGPSSGANAAASSTLGASTNGPAPSAQSRLKNKSMDEIITRWASDLAKYQKEFQKQAEKVASWDRMLVDNSEKIQKLYGSTLEAERATVEVERQITAVENDQNELESWLDRYEKEVDQMISNQSDSFQGPDLERERTYHLAEKLSSRLDEMGKDLGSMVEEINDASSSLNRNSKPDDPLSQVVRVLNSHLTQLQQIDQGANALKLKVAAAEKASRSMGATNGFNGPSSDAADSFYRSFMGKR